MSSVHALAGAAALPAGIWITDPAQSRAGFAIEQIAVRASFGQFSARLSVDPDGRATLVGSARAASITGELAALLASPEFFDAERYPELRFESSAIRRHGEFIELDGRLTVKNRTLAVAGTGTVKDDGQKRISLSAETRIDRRQFGLAPNLAGGNEVKLEVGLALTRAEA